MFLNKPYVARFLSHVEKTVQTGIATGNADLLLDIKHLTEAVQEIVQSALDEAYTADKGTSFITADGKTKVTIRVTPATEAHSKKRIILKKGLTPEQLAWLVENDYAEEGLTNYKKKPRAVTLAEKVIEE